MVVQGLGGPPAIRQPVRRASLRSGFRVSEEADATEPAAAAAPVAMPSLLAMQEAETDAARDRDARRHGEAVMQELCGLQRGLLGGPVDARRLAALAVRTPEAADPRLAMVMRAIQLRAQIELLRHTPAASGPQVTTLP